MSSSQNQSYQQSMERLELILQNIDNSDIAIDELALQVQEAAELLKNCKKILVKTEKEVQKSLDSLENEFDENTPQE
ncbi:MAG: exodeoxyribonuclease VII small subunit [Fibrobacter sp.]|nr:exodeoxyribonuclease VII small subunit [Fibrobacter sp.]